MLVSIFSQLVGPLLVVGAPPAPAAADPCKLVTKAEAEAIVGEKLSPGTREDTGGISVCFYYTPEQGRGMLAVYLGKVETDKQRKEYFEEPLKAKGSAIHREEGLGDEALSLSINMMGTKLAQVNVRTGKQLVLVQLRRRGADAGGEEDRRLAVRAAKLALGRVS
jgi:hypothetical protein